MWLNRLHEWPYLLLWVVLYSSSANGQAIISGKILNHDGKTPISYYETKQGILAPYWKEVMPDINGRFKIKVDNPGYGTFQIFFDRMIYRFFHDETSKIHFEFDQSEIKFPKSYYGSTSDWKNRSFIRDSVKQVVTKSISGDFKEVNTFYNQSERISTLTGSVNGNGYSRALYYVDSPKKAVHFIDSIAQIEIDKINSLAGPLSVEKEPSYKIDENVKGFLRNEVYAYYANIFMDGMFLKRKEQVTRLSKDSTAAADIYNEQWERLAENFLNEMKRVLRPAPNSWDYNWFIKQSEYFMKSYQEYEFPQSNDLDKTIEAGLINIDSLLLEDSETILAFRLMNLKKYLNGQMFYSPALLDAVYELQRIYPDSEHIKDMQPLVEKLKRSIEADAKDFDKGIVLKKNYTSFKDFLAQFQGQNILIDVWATWCHPCIGDFKYKNFIQPFIDSSDLTVVYVSIDKPAWKDRWRQSLKYNELEGYHIRANNELIIDMWDFLGGYEGAIPRYTLIAKDGSIFKATASRLSDNGKLVGEIEKMIMESR